MVYQGLSHGLIENILFGINVHLEVQLSMSVSAKHKSQLKILSARFRPSQSALSYCQIRRLYVDGLCTLIKGISADIICYDRCYPKGGEIDILQIARFFEITI